MPVLRSPNLSFDYAEEERVLVWDSPSAEVYHWGYCAGLKRCIHAVYEVSKSKAVQMGRRACGNCY